MTPMPDADITADLDLTRRATFKLFVPITLRYSDQDPMQHINNCAYAAFVEAARVKLIQQVIDGFDHDGLDFILARVAIDYRKELHFPNTIDVGARLTRLGTKSLSSGYGVFLGDDCVATAESVNVFYDMKTRKTVAPPDDVRDAMQKLLAEG